MPNKKRLIDAKKLYEAAYKSYGPRANLCDECYSEIINLIDDAPTVDAVEVVRCKECKKWKCHGMPFDITRGTCHNPRFHLHHGHVIEECFMPVTNEMDFCSYGERREG